MKYSELHNLVISKGWILDHTKGSHYFYKKEGRLSYPIPFHGSKEIGEGLKNKIFKEMGINISNKLKK